MKDFCDTEGIIIDLRHYPSTVITYLLGEYIIPKTKVFACIGMPNKAMPGAFYEQEMVVGKGVLKEIQNDSRTFDSYEGKVIILMDEESQSQSEFAIMAFASGSECYCCRKSLRWSGWKCGQGVPAGRSDFLYDRSRSIYTGR